MVEHELSKEILKKDIAQFKEGRHEDPPEQEDD